MNESDPSHHHLSFAADGLDPGVMRPIRLQVSEGLSEPYRVEVLLRGDGGEIDPSSLLFKIAEVIVTTSTGEPLRRFAGIVTRARERVRAAASARGDTPTQRQRVELVLESPLALLALTSDFRIFQEKTTADIVQTVFEEHGVPAELLDLRVQGSLPKRATCTQAGERTSDFVCRLLEEDGIFHYVECTEDAFRLVLTDSVSSFTDLGTIAYRPPSGLVSTAAITEIGAAGAIAATDVVLGDHDFEKPSLSLEAKASRSVTPAIEYYDFPAGHRTTSEGSARAKALKEAFDAEGTFAQATSHAFEIAAGTKIEVEGTETSLDRKWSVRSVRHRWEDQEGRASYENDLVLLPDDAPFRPLPRTKRPFMRGPQVAIVTGPSGADVHCDERGRVKVRFPWDRRATVDDKSSGWVRVMQLPMAGAVAIPRVGWEVLVEFENGDPDRPIVVGRLFNARYLPPYALPGHRTVTALGSLVSPGRDGENLLRIDDASGSERIRLHAQKDLELVVEENMVETVTKSENVGVIGKQTVTVEGDQTVSIDKDHELRIGGKQTWTVQGTRTAKIKGEETFTVAKDHSLTVAAAHERKTDASDTIQIKGNLSETIGAALTMKSKKEIRWLVAGDASVTIGAAATETSDEGRSELVIGGRTDTVAAAEILTSGKDLSLRTKGDRSLTVGAALAYSAGGTLQIGSGDELSFTIGAALALSGASAIVLKVGSSSVTLANGAVVLKSSKIKLTASGPNAQLAGVVADK